MSGAKPWQIALIVIGLLAGIIGVVFAMRGMGPVETAADVTLVDVYTGELFEANTSGRSVMIPMLNPDTGEASLFPVAKDEETGEWHIAGRYLSAFRMRTEGKETPPVDKSSGLVEATGRPRSL
ncbi:MAG: hypothetical protein AAFS11_03900 [Planctomycetota bacterium]